MTQAMNKRTSCVRELPSGRFQSRIGYAGKTYTLGVYDDEASATAVYDTVKSLLEDVSLNTVTIDWHNKQVKKAVNKEADIQRRIRLRGGFHTQSELNSAVRKGRIDELETLVTDMDNIGRLTNYAKIKGHVISRLNKLKESK